MKLTIWQQFSSNHSSGFSVVGKFKSVEEANKAADELRAIIKAIRYDTSPVSPADGEDNLYRSYDPLTEKEVAIGNYYDIEWKIHIDWAVGDENVAQFDNYVVVSDNPAESHIGAIYIDRIMAKLSDEVYIEQRTACI